ncbi:MAG: ATPase, T2SS/T4P/T4SS family [Alphaproteobacteria bacterium]|nr:ATPase, T2SS/T4P/T4SS family [Alphaproteobacteria bacterium]
MRLERVLKRLGIQTAPRLLRHAPGIDEEMRSMCAPWSDGRVVLLHGFEQHPRLRQVIRDLQRGGYLPQQLREESGDAAALQRMWQGRVAATGDEGDATIQLWVRRIYTEAVAARAADVMFELADDGLDVFVIANDRKARIVERLPPATGHRVLGYMFHVKDAGSAQTGYQRGSFQGFSIRNGEGIPLPPEVAGLRCQRGPSEPDRDHLYTRIFYNGQIPVDATLEKLGYARATAQVFAEVRSMLRGACIIGGVTGDGKSTTLATNMALLHSEWGGRLNVVTVEDPVEYPIPGAVQIAVPTTGVGEERGRHYVEALMHFCRIHPAVGMVSEIRDGDAARQVLQFVDSGHQVWTTIHTANANSILFRLMDLGVTPGEVAKPGNIALLVQQTLVPQLCRSCARDRPPPAITERLAAIVGNWSRVAWRNVEGCPDCVPAHASAASREAWAGYTGAQAVAEIIRPDTGYLAYVQARDPAGALRYWLEDLGGEPLAAQIWELVFRGLIDPTDAVRKGAGYDAGEAFAARMAARFTTDHEIRPMFRQPPVLPDERPERPLAVAAPAAGAGTVTRQGPVETGPGALRRRSTRIGAGRRGRNAASKSAEAR